MALALFSDPMFSEMERAVSRAFAPLFSTPSLPSAGALAAAVHPMDVVEHPDRFTVVADAPGMTPDDIKVELRGDALVVSGEKKVESAKDMMMNEKGTRVHRMERSFTKFTRSFVLPENVRTDGITARMDHGVLTVDLPKVEVQPKKDEPKRIKVMPGAGTASTAA